jgi:hypothetical protein
MNPLKRDIKRGEVVVLRRDAVAPDLTKYRERAFVCDHGPGMAIRGNGSAIYGRWLADGEADRIAATEIDPGATAAFLSAEVAKRAARAAKSA